MLQNKHFSIGRLGLNAHVLIKINDILEIDVNILQNNCKFIFKICKSSLKIWRIIQP